MRLLNALAGRIASIETFFEYCDCMACPDCDEFDEGRRHDLCYRCVLCKKVVASADITLHAAADRVL